MSSASAHIHAWILPVEIDTDVWNGLHGDIVRVLSAASRDLEQHRDQSAPAVLRGPNGFGPLVIRADSIAFNGNAFLGAAGDAFVIERVAQSNIVSRRNSDGERRAVRRCDTGGHVYDLAVCGALLVVAHKLGDAARVGTSGSLRTGWGRAAALVRETLALNGQLLQQENGVIRWIGDAAPRARRLTSSA